jgi:predicted PurR-regulated permease PerM
MTRQARFQRIFLLLLVVVISAVFLLVIRAFLLTILLAAIFAGVAHPLYSGLLRIFHGRAAAASLTTLLLLFILVAGPLATIAGIVTNQALQVSDNVRPRVEELVRQPTLLDTYLQHLPFYERLRPYKAEILTRAGAVIGTVGSAAVGGLTVTIGSTLLVFARLVIMLYTMFFLLKDGRQMLAHALTYLPLSDEAKTRMVGKFVSVAKATLKGTLLIGVIQGTLSAFAFWIAGIQGWVFWGTIMIVMSIIPGIGGAIVWVPAAIILLITGSAWQGLFLLAFCGGVVGTIDNLLRPRLVGRDTQLHELLIFFSTLGGLLLFGPMGFIIGPIIAALFVTVWDLYAETFRAELQADPTTEV